MGFIFKNVSVLIFFISEIKTAHSQVIFFHIKMKLIIHPETQIFTLTQQVFPAIITICIFFPAQKYILY